MSLPAFLHCVPLPDFEGLKLAVTATRSLELFSDLARRVKQLAPLKWAERFDVMDECLDVVLIEPDQPAGFAFTGLSLAELWAALLADPAAVADLAAWRQALAVEGIQALREAARARIGARPRCTYFGEIRVWMPSQYRSAPLVILPPALARLLKAANPNWEPSRRSRWCVELTHMLGAPGYRLPTRGKRFPVRGAPFLSRWLGWEYMRLQPQPTVVGIEHWELLLTLPSLETSYFSNHFRVRNLFAHLRVTRVFDRELKAAVLVLDEVQSDWIIDLRRQRLGRPRPNPSLSRDWSGDWSAQPVPACPVERDWLTIAVDALIDHAHVHGCDSIAWVPGAIQRELNPTLPLSVAQRLYDRDFPRRLRERLSRRAPERSILQEVRIQYPTYRRDRLIANRRGKGWFLVAGDGETPVSCAVRDYGAIFDLFRDEATPVLESLPAIAMPGRLLSELEATRTLELGPLAADLEALASKRASRQQLPSRRHFPFVSLEGDALFECACDLTEAEAGRHEEHWEIFDRRLDDFIATELAEAVQHAHRVELGHVDVKEQAWLMAAGETCGMGLLHSDRPEDCNQVGILIVVALTRDSDTKNPAERSVAAYPFFAGGRDFEVRVEEVYLYPNRLEARLDISIKGISLWVFDALFYQHRTFYRGGQKVRFRLCGLAYDIAPTQPEETLIDDPETIRRMRAIQAWKDQYGFYSPQLDEAAALAAWKETSQADREPIQNQWSLDPSLSQGEGSSTEDVWYQGEVVHLVPDAHRLLGVPVWRVDIVVGRLDDDPWIVPFFVTEHTFKDGWRPSPGDNVSGSAWIQGWMVTD
ncbi:hypothetical protein [uncultured Thiocystis sp.]|jgi:hypothetical protein|uniref:hypothetical protein n=1 Tax=uncultured Thiocystis sp. TaxID=1202134 RepID=UPI0026008CD0|nr:hypothetical protein [uncultured Thiocystis sp.]